METATCKRCKTNPATVRLRQEVTCETCFHQFIVSKVVKRMTQTLKESRIATPSTRPKFLLGLSFGPSSSGLLHVLSQNIQYIQAKNPRNVYELLVVHVDSNPTPLADSPHGTAARQILAQYQERFPIFSFQCLDLSSALALNTIDWATLPALPLDIIPDLQLSNLLENLPSLTSRVDIVRLFTRHLLLSCAVENSCNALLLGSSTTALAELTLAETAKGKGFAVPWQVNDGPYPILTYSPPSSDLQEGQESTPRAPPIKTTFPIYHPFGDTLRREILLYNGSVSPPMTDLVPKTEVRRSTVISHKDLSIEDVMAQYFEGVEESYPSVVTNVVRTTGKLARLSGQESCGACGMAVDEQGDARWKGEIGDDDVAAKRQRGTGHLCYGCERSIYG